MKKFLFGLLGLIVISLLFLFIYFYAVLPGVGAAPDIRIEVTEARLIRGEYLSRYVTGCVHCHSTRDFSKFGGPVDKETHGKGGFIFSEEMGLPGNIVASNITPAALSDWTDGELARAITSGINKDGNVLFPLMPYHDFNHFSKEDLYATIAYIRSLESIETDHPETEIVFPVSMFIRGAPSEYEPKSHPDESNSSEYGKYLTEIAGCKNCHTPMEKGQPVEEMVFAGGAEFIMPEYGVVRSSNLTPHMSTGIGSWSKEQFIKKFKFYNDSTYTPADLQPGHFQTTMPWLDFAHMKEEDLSAIYDYISTIEPIENGVVKFTPEAK